jgi:signal transduction histidine kinase
MTTPETILLIDDEPSLRMNLRAFLEDAGYRVLEAGEGLEAIGTCTRQCPDLILMDINMPGMDGFEVCRRIKADPGSVEIPVIFLSACLQTADKVAAFNCGGVDYVTKPFQFDDLAARIGTHLELQRQRRILRDQHAALVRLEAQRDAFTHMMVHDMRSPLTGLMGSLELVLGALPQQRVEERRHLVRAQACTERILGMVSGLLELNRLESGSMPMQPSLFDLAGLARETASVLGCARGRRRLSVSGTGPEYAWGDPELTRRVLTNLMENACKFTARDGRVDVRVTCTEAFARVVVDDDGSGILPEHKHIIFDKFSQASKELRSQGFGLGLAFCRLAVEAQGGEIGVDSEPGKGSAFWFTLPAREPGIALVSPEARPAG